MLATTLPLDPKLREFATPRQAELFDAVQKHGNHRAAARALGLSHDATRNMVKALEKKAAIQGGYAPRFGLAREIAPGFMARGHSTMDKVFPDGSREMVVQWTKTRVDDEARYAAIEAAIGSAVAALPRLKPIRSPKKTRDEICNMITFTDYHMGMYARAAETGADWNMEIAEQLLVAAFEDLITRAQPGRQLVLNIQGDFLHFDSQRPVTPTHGHVLDAAGSYSHMVEVAIRVLRRLCDLALMSHDEVHLIMCQGNHDLASMVVLRHTFAALYEKEPRLTVNASQTPYYAHEFGKVMIGIHHGHLKKNEQLPLLFATRYAEMWGRTTRRYANSGHRHHLDVKEHSGMTVIQHQTLAPADKHSSDGGWDSDRAATLMTFHAQFGKISEQVFVPEMVTLNDDLKGQLAA